MQSVLDALNAISVEARKKFPKLKEAAERAMLLKKPEAIWVPVSMALETKDEKMITLALGVIQRMDVVDGTVAKLQEAARSSTTSETTQLRILQTLVTLMMKPELSELELRSGLGLCSLLAGGTSSSSSSGSLAVTPAVASVGQAALRQGVQLCGGHKGLAQELIKELCATACSESGSAHQMVMVDAITALELVESMSESVSDAYVCPMLHRLLGNEKSVRGMRALLRLVLRISQSSQHAETEVLLVKCCRLLNEAAEGSSAQLLLLELVQVIVSQPGTLLDMFERHDSVVAVSSPSPAPDGGRVGLAATLVRALAKACGLAWRWSPEDLSDAACSPAPGRLLDGGSGGAASVPRARLGRVMVAALESVCDALRDASPPQTRGAMLAVMWPSLLGALGLILSKATSGALVASLCVDSFVSLIATCASIGETASAPRDALVNAIIKCADEEGAGERQVVCTLGLLRASRAAQGLGATSWYAVLGLLLRVMRRRPEEELDPFDEGLAAQVEARLHGRIEETARLQDDSEQGRLVQQVRRLACDSTHLAPPERSTFVAALCKLSQSTLHSSSSSTPPSSSSSSSSSSASLASSGAARMWPLDRLCETLLWSQHEAALWDDAAGHLAAAACAHSLPMVRERACSAIVALCGHAARAPLQTSGLLGALCCAGYAEVRTAGLRGLERLLRSGLLGESEEAWSAALSGLGSVASAGKRDEVAQLVVEEWLPTMKPALLDVLCGHVLLPFAAQTADSSAALSVPTLVWSVAHHISSQQLVRCWGPLLRLLSSGARDHREEVRSGALRTLFKMPEMHSWPRAVSEDYLLQVLAPLLLELGRLSLRAVPPSEAWLATAALAVAGVADARLDAPLTELLAAVLAAPVPNNMAASAKTFRASVNQLCAALAALLSRSSSDAWNKVGLPALSLMLARALSECADLLASAGASNTNSSRFANYFVLCDAVRALSGAPDLAGFLCLLLRDGAALFDETYRSASILYDPVNFKSHAPSPLTAAVLSALAQCHSSSSLGSVACALALAASVGLVFEGPPALLLVSSDLPFPNFPPDPPLPFAVRPALLPLARGALALLRSRPAALSAFPVLCCALGVVSRTLELCEESVAAFAAALPSAALAGASLQMAIDLCHALLIWDLAPSSSSSLCARLLVSAPLASPAASSALVAAATPASCAALLHAHDPVALPLARTLLRSLHPGIAQLARDLLATEGGLKELLLLLFDDLVFATANAPEPETRQSVAQCLYELSRVLK